MTRTHFAVLLLVAPMVLLHSPGQAAADSGPCGELRLADGEVIVQRALPAVSPLSNETKACLQAVGKAVADRPYIRSITVAARMTAEQRQDGKGLEVANAAADALIQSGVPKHRVSVVAPAIGHGQSPGIALVYRERRTTRRVARIVSVTGSVHRGRELESLQQARKGNDLVVHDHVRTAENSSAVVLLADKSLLYIGSQSMVRFGTIELDQNLQRQVRLDLVTGEVFVMASRAASGALFEIVTRTAVAGVRGTHFRVSIDEQGTNRLSTATGAVELINPAGQSVQVNAGYGSLAQPGQPPLPPRPLLRGAIIAAPRLGTFQQAPSLSWKPVTGAIAYRVELARDAQFTRELVQSELEGTTMTADPSLASGKWFWRVMAIDADSLVGLPSKIYAFEVRP